MAPGVGGHKHPCVVGHGVACPGERDFLWTLAQRCWRAVKVPGQRVPQSDPLKTFWNTKVDVSFAEGGVVRLD